MVEVREKQTGKFLKSKILEILAKYEIGVERIFCVTCDNGANMLATVRELRKEFEIILNGEASDNEDDEADEQAAWTILRSVLPEFQESVNLVRCGVHTLQLAVNDVTKRHDQHIRRISEVAKHCHLTDSWSFIHDYLETFEPVYYCTKNMQMHHVGLSDLVMAWLDAAYKVSMVESSLAKELSQALDSRLQMLKKCLPLKAALFLDPRFHYLDSTLFKDDEKAELRKFIRDTSTRIAALSSVADKTPQSAEPKPNPRDGFQAYLCGMFGGQPTTSKAGGKLSLDE
ncbi:hypothetical protein pipiens_019730 [Culex pipiens pipiens]|uniref:Transposase n=1 Tax=Culex pipiens pipiens TaxID=38569 RepID=A0ABD1DRY0_CULPP